MQNVARTRLSDHWKYQHLKECTEDGTDEYLPGVKLGLGPERGDIVPCWGVWWGTCQSEECPIQAEALCRPLQPRCLTATTRGLSSWSLSAGCKCSLFCRWCRQGRLRFSSIYLDMLNDFSWGFGWPVCLFVWLDLGLFAKGAIAILPHSSADTEHLVGTSLFVMPDAFLDQLLLSDEFVFFGFPYKFNSSVPWCFLANAAESIFEHRSVHEKDGEDLLVVGRGQLFSTSWGSKDRYEKSDHEHALS